MGIDGLYVMSVSSNTPAGDARLAAGDIITHVKNSAVRTDPEVCGVLQSSTAGEKLSIDGVFTESGTYADGTPYEAGDTWQIDMTLDK